ncbi:MAG: hypothetical protein K9G33_15460 [Sneathiella sp.]|nr:hypothetical protein [Sneathiella sp.]
MNSCNEQHSFLVRMRKCFERLYFVLDASLISGIGSKAGTWAVLASLALFLTGCATTQDALLLSGSDVNSAVKTHEVAVLGTVVFRDYSGRKYIENYLYGGVPLRARIYADVNFRVDRILKGAVNVSEIRLRSVLANGQGFPLFLGDRYVIAFDGAVDEPSSLTLVPIKINERAEEAINEIAKPQHTK